MRLRHWVFTIKKNGIEEAMHYYREEVKVFYAVVYAWNISTYVLDISTYYKNVNSLLPIQDYCDDKHRFKVI